MVVIPLSLASIPSFAASPDIFLFDVLNRATYRASFVKMTRGQSGLPAWAATPSALGSSTDAPGILVKIDGEEREIFEACEAHNCGGNTLIVMFSDYGATAKAVLAINGRNKFFDAPTPTESKALLARISK